MAQIDYRGLHHYEEMLCAGDAGPVLIMMDTGNGMTVNNLEVRTESLRLRNDFSHLDPGCFLLQVANRLYCLQLAFGLGHSIKPGNASDE